MKRVFYVLSLLVSVFWLQEVNAQRIPFQGRLFENGEPITGTVNLVFSFNELGWTETHNNVVVSDGLYSVELGTTSPVPSTLFFGVESRMLSVSVNGTQLDPIPIYPSLTTNSFVLEIDEAPDGKDAVSYSITGVGTAGKLYRPFVGTSSVSNGLNGGVTGIGIAPAGNTNNTYGIFGRATGEGAGQNRGVYGEAISHSTSSSAQYGLVGRAIGEGTGNHFGVFAEVISPAASSTVQYGASFRAQGSGTGIHYGVFATSTGTHDNFGALTSATGNGKNNVGIRGLASGTGNGETGYGIGSYNNGVQGFARSNSWGNTGVFGYVYNDPIEGGVGVDNIGVVGRSEVNNGTAEMHNIGVKGDAWGSGINKGVVGTAQNGVENWAGWFEGDVKVAGNLHIDGDSRINSSFTANSILAVDGRNNEPVVQTGLKFWEPENLDNGYLWMKGKNPDGNLSEGIFMDANSYNDGTNDIMEGRIILKHFTNSNYVGEKQLTFGYFNDLENRLDDVETNNYQLPENVMIYRAEYDDNGTPAFGGEIGLSRSTGTGIRLQNQDPSGGHIALDGTDGNYIYLWGNSSMDVGGKISLSKLEGSDEFAGEINIQGHESPNIIMGGQHWHDMDMANMSFFGNQSNGEGWFHDHINLSVGKDVDQQWGSIGLRGSNGNPNTTIGGKHWEGLTGANRPYFKMNGQDENLDLVFLDVRDDGEGGEMAGINFAATGGELTTVDSRGVYVNNFKVVVDTDSNDDGQIHIHSQSNTAIRMYGNFDNDNTSHIALDGTEGNHIHLWGQGNINATGTVSANILVSTDGTVQTSDLRLKTNVFELENALEKTNQLRGVSYNWNDPKKSQTRQIGLIAQEVEQVYPELVQNLSDGTKAVNYTQLVAVLVESIKELNKKIESLEDQNKKLQANLNSQDEMMKEMELLRALVLEVMNKDSQEAKKFVNNTNEK